MVKFLLRSIQVHYAISLRCEPGRSSPYGERSLEKLTEHLEASRFLRTHKSYIVNVAFIKTMGKNSFLMKDGTEVPIGRIHIVSCKRDYMKYLAKQ